MIKKGQLDSGVDVQGLYNLIKNALPRKELAFAEFIDNSLQAWEDAKNSDHLDSGDDYKNFLEIKIRCI